MPAAPPRRTPSADDLIVLLAVAREGRYTGAGTRLGLNHTTIARRIDALEQALGGRVLVRGAAGWVLTPLGEHALAAAEDVEQAMRRLSPDEPTLAGVVRLSATDGFSGFIASPAMAALRARHPDVSLEVVAATRRAAQQRVGVDLEVVVGRPHVHRAEAIHLGDYVLGLYASRSLLARCGTPASVDDLAGEPLVYFIESMLQVDALDAARRSTRGMVDAVSSTNVYVHVDATRAGAGFGLLPAFLADPHDDLVRLFPDEVEERLPYWLVCRPEALRQPTAVAFIAALRMRMDEARDALLGRPAAAW
ncbi:LysR family transcriptional regulator [Agromyces bracchium]|uniref:LysR family transcriptional regulator n=1 Tax=Agromyces bracchium TaxID=88376 RepID=A0A6I3M600_9MICO|nr:LysR family transcriptional regulator [Agromyces bracchium]MTH68725.1 LysR family transcriptional regulator [Agromyces bracchium]